MGRIRTILQPHVGNAHRLSLRHGLGCSRFARHYSGNRDFFLFLALLRCFSSRTYLRCTYGFSAGYPRITTGGFPHSEIPGSKSVQRLPRAYRSRPRPSSAPDAKASTVCPYSLIFITEIKNTNYHYAVIKERAAVPQGCQLYRGRTNLALACQSLKAEQWKPEQALRNAVTAGPNEVDVIPGEPLDEVRRPRSGKSPRSKPRLHIRRGRPRCVIAPLP